MQMPDALFAADRAGLLSDAFALADYGIIQPSSFPLDFADYMGETEKAYEPWVAFAQGINRIAPRLQSQSNAGDDLRQYLQNTYSRIYVDVYTDSVADDHMVALQLAHIVNAACAVGVPACVRDMQRRFNQFQTKLAQVPADLQYVRSAR